MKETDLFWCVIGTIHFFTTGILTSEENVLRNKIPDLNSNYKIQTISICE